MSRKSVIHLLSFAIVLALSIGTVNNTYTANYLSLIKDDAQTVSTTKDSLYSEIKKHAPRYEIEPKNAVIDPVWKAIPGYNGRKVDLKASYQKMKKVGKFDEKKLVFKQIPPTVHLRDLSPAPIYKGHPDKKMVSFLINVAWGNEYIPSMLETLKKHNVKATFFLEGRWVKKYPDLAKMILEEGHEIGNHSYSHPNLEASTEGRIKQELKKTNEMIKATLGIEPTWFAPPSGSYRDAVVRIAAEMKMGTIMWTVDTVDWKKPPPQVIVSRINQKVHPGAMILMHPTASASSALEPMIKTLLEKEYRIANVSTLLSEERLD